MDFERNTKKVIPMIMLVFISSATMINVYNIISPQLTVDFGIDPATVSLLGMITMLMMGVASVAYSTLSDFISIRKLMVFGVVLLNIGSVMGFLVSGSHFYLLLAASAMMVAGGTCGSGLMIIIVTRYIEEKEHAKYYGFNTACVSISQAVGILLGGFFATYIGWKFAYLIPVVSIIALPFIIKYVPDEKKRKDGRLDVVGLALLTLFTLMISLYFNFGKLSYLVISLLLFVLFFLYIAKNKKAFISIEFFKNTRFVVVILLVALTFGVQTAFGFLFSFMAQGVHGIALDQVSLLLLPSYVLAACIAMNSGKIVNRFKGFPTLCGALLLIVFSLIFGALFLDKSVILLGISACLFAGSYALIYAPFMQIVISTLAPEQIGAGIGFFNLMTSVGPSILIVLTGKMMASASMGHSIIPVGEKAAVYSNILLVFAAVVFFAFLCLKAGRSRFEKKEER